MRQKLLFVLLLVALTAWLTPKVLAAKPRLRRSESQPACKIPIATVRKSSAIHSISVTFNNLEKIKTVWYSLSYKHAGTVQAVAGSLTPKGQTTDQRDLYLGTCSSGVCTPHFPKSAALTITTTNLSGCSFRTRYIVRY